MILHFVMEYISLFLLTSSMAGIIGTVVYALLKQKLDNIYVTTEHCRKIKKDCEAHMGLKFLEREKTYDEFVSKSQCSLLRDGVHKDIAFLQESIVSMKKDIEFIREFIMKGQVHKND